MLRESFVDDKFQHAEGCEVNPVPYGCLSCPLPFCKYDDPGAYIAWQRGEKRRGLKALVRQEGTDITAAVAGVAMKLEVTPRTIWRGLKEEV